MYTHCAAALTDDGQLWLLYDFGHPDVAILLAKCDQISTEIRETLRLYDRQLLQEMVFNVATALFNVLDNRAVRQVTSASLSTSELAFLASEDRALDQIRKRTQATMVRRGRQRYFYGVLFGAVLSLLVIASIGAENDVLDRGFKLVFGDNVPMPPQEMMYCLLAGGFGAIVSVLQRFTSGKLKVDESARANTQYVFGGVRPALGAALGGVAYLFLKAGLLNTVDATNTTDAEAALYFTYTIAFIAGFSERFMQEVIASTEQQTGTTSVTNPAAVVPDAIAGEATRDMNG